MRYYLGIAIILVLGIGGGGISAKWALDTEYGFGSVKYGQWTSWPLSGSVDADPYTKARVARDGSVPLGAAEGLTFFMSRDESGDPLMRQCQYTLSGNTPPSRMWTLSAQDQKNRPVPAHAGGTGAIFSQSILRKTNGSFEVNIGREPAPGNWLTISGKGPMRLVLRLYDTPITGGGGLLNPDMPKLATRDCAK